MSERTKTRDGRRALDLAERRRRALQLLNMGMDYAAIARELGTRVHVVGALVAAEVRKLPEFERTEYRRIELEKLAQLERPFWSLALVKNTKAARLILQISERRARMLGLDRVPDGGSLEDGERGDQRRLPGGGEGQKALPAFLLTEKVLRAMQEGYIEAEFARLPDDSGGAGGVGVSEQRGENAEDEDEVK